MAQRREGITAQSRFVPCTTVRVLRGEDELAQAVARAAEGAERLRDRLDARAAHDAWMADHTEQRVGWLRFVRGTTEGAPLVVRDQGPGERRESRSPAA